MNRSDLAFYILGKKHGYNLKQMYQFVLENQYWDKKDIEEYQTEKMKQIITHSYNNTIYYKEVLDELSLKPSDFQSLADLKKLPIIGKADIRDRWKDLIASDYLKYKPMHRVTSGTTGQTFQYYNDAKSWGMNWATKIRTFSWGGYTFGKDKIATLKGGSMLREAKQSVKGRFWKYLNNYYDLPVINLTNESMEQYYNEIISNKIKYLRGFPTAVYAFAKYIYETHGELPLQATFTSAEYLQDFQREQITKTFGTNHIDAYGCGDGMAGANQCEKTEGYHVNIETSILEVINEQGNSCKEGEQGEIVLTSLNDYAMPLIRYTPGDVAVIGKNNCSCGRTLPLLSKIVGRTSDLIYLPNGRILNGIAIPFADWVDKIDKFQIWHTEIDKIELKVIKKPTLTKKDIEYMHEILAYHVGEGIRVQVDIVDDIPLLPNGKFKYVISKVNNG